jgi:hypothetical protein
MECIEMEIDHRIDMFGITDFTWLERLTEFEHIRTLIDNYKI